MTAVIPAQLRQSPLVLCRPPLFRFEFKKAATGIENSALPLESFRYSNVAIGGGGERQLNSRGNMMQIIEKREKKDNLSENRKVKSYAVPAYKRATFVTCHSFFLVGVIDSPRARLSPASSSRENGCVEADCCCCRCCGFDCCDW